MRRGSSVVEQRPEKPCVGSSILLLGTIHFFDNRLWRFFYVSSFLRRQESIPFPVILNLIQDPGNKTYSVSSLPFVLLVTKVRKIIRRTKTRYKQSSSRDRFHLAQTVCPPKPFSVCDENRNVATPPLFFVYEGDEK